MINLLKGSCLVLESIATLRCVAKVEGVDSVVVWIIKVLNRILHPSMLLRKGIAHILVLSKHDEDLLAGIDVVFLPELFDGFVSSLVDPLLGQVLGSVLLR